MVCKEGSSKNYLDKKRLVGGQKNVHNWSRDILYIPTGSLRSKFEEVKA